MGGKRLTSFRGGDRSEYLAQYALSRFSYVIPWPRQEDFGVTDFLCVLARDEDRYSWAENGFYVQVKSGDDPIRFEKDAVKWLSFHMDLPFFVCVVDKRKSQLRLFTCCKIWKGLFLRSEPPALVLDLTVPECEAEPTIDVDGVITVPIGPPVINTSLDEIEQRPRHFFNVLKPWLDLDQRNIAHRSVGRIFSSCFALWSPNTPVNDSAPVGNTYVYGPRFANAERQLAPLLTALAANYHANKQTEKRNAAVELLRTLTEYLDDEGRHFVNGDFSAVDKSIGKSAT